MGVNKLYFSVFCFFVLFLFFFSLLPIYFPFLFCVIFPSPSPHTGMRCLGCSFWGWPGFSRCVFAGESGALWWAPARCLRRAVLGLRDSRRRCSRSGRRGPASSETVPHGAPRPASGARAGHPPDGRGASRPVDSRETRAPGVLPAAASPLGIRSPSWPLLFVRGECEGPPVPTPGSRIGLPRGPASAPAAGGLAAAVRHPLTEQLKEKARPGPRQPPPLGT